MVVTAGDGADGRGTPGARRRGRARPAVRAARPRGRGVPEENTRSPSQALGLRRGEHGEGRRRLLVHLPPGQSAAAAAASDAQEAERAGDGGAEGGGDLRQEYAAGRGGGIYSREERRWQRRQSAETREEEESRVRGPQDSLRVDLPQQIEAAQEEPETPRFSELQEPG